MTFALGAAGAYAFPQRNGQAQQRQSRRLIIDGLGEIHLEYDAALLDEMLASGMRGCVITVGNPALHGATAYDDMKNEIEAYDRHLAANSTRLTKATTAADLGRTAETGKIGLIYYTQNATPIQDEIEKLSALHGLGVRIVQLTYNTRNLQHPQSSRRRLPGTHQRRAEQVRA